MSPPKSTPMIKQYLSIKEQYPDAILFYRMGDFYEMFFDDAEEGSRLLGITLTSRNNGGSGDVPLAGVPAKALDDYLARLVKLGRRVAICDQVEDPAKAKGLVAGVCKACANKMETIVEAKSLGLPLLEDMMGHPGMARYRDAGFEIITF